MSSNVIPINRMRPDPHAEQDLRWYFQFSSGEMGLRSNWEAYAREGQFLTRLRSTFSVDLKAVHLDLRAADRELSIRKALAELSPEDRGTLAAAYGDVREAMKTWPGVGANEAAELLLGYRDLTGIAPWAAQDAHRSSRTTRPVVDWLLRIHRRAKADPVAARAKGDVIRAAELQLLGAVRAYSSAKRQSRRA